MNELFSRSVTQSDIKSQENAGHFRCEVRCSTFNFFLLGARELRLTSSFATSLRSAQRQQRLFKTVKIETGLLEN